MALQDDVTILREALGRWHPSEGTSFEQEALDRIVDRIAAALDPPEHTAPPPRGDGDGPPYLRPALTREAVLAEIGKAERAACRSISLPIADLKLLLKPEGVVFAAAGLGGRGGANSSSYEGSSTSVSPGGVVGGGGGAATGAGYAEAYRRGLKDGREEAFKAMADFIAEATPRDT